IGNPQIVAIGREPVRDHAFPHLLLGKGVNHIVFLGHLADPTVTLNHAAPLRKSSGPMTERLLPKRSWRCSTANCKSIKNYRMIYGWLGSSYERTGEIDNLPISPIVSIT